MFKSNKEQKSGQTNEKNRALVKHKDSKPDKAEKSEKAKRASKVRFALEQEPKVDMYYYRIYRKLRLLRYLCVLIAALFVMTVPMVYSDQITTDNFKYLMKYINLQLSEDGEEYAPFSYEKSEALDFGIHSEDVVLCNDSSIVFYDKLGNESLRVSFGPFKNPTMLISKAYVLVYDRGGNEYVILNNFKMLHQSKTNYPIMHCTLDDGGRYAILTSNGNYTSEVLVYNRNFKQTNRIQKDVYVSDLFFTNEEGGFGYTAFTTDTSGEMSGEICVYDAKSEKKLEIRENSIPLKALPDGDTIKVLYQDGIRWYDVNGEVQRVYEFNDQPNTFYYTSEKTVICFQSESGDGFGYSEFIGDAENEIVRIENTEFIHTIQWHDNKFFMISSQGLTVLDEIEKTVSKAALPGLKKILFLPEGKLMGCYADKTATILPSEFQIIDQE